MEGGKHVNTATVEDYIDLWSDCPASPTKLNTICIFDLAMSRLTVRR